MNKSCVRNSNCIFLIKNSNTKCKFSTLEKEKRNIFIDQCFLPIIYSEKDFNQTVSHIHQGYLNYYSCVISLFSSMLSLIFLNFVLVFNIYNGLMIGVFEFVLIILIFQTLIFIMIFVSAHIKNKVKNKFLIVLFTLVFAFTIIGYFGISYSLAIMINFLNPGEYSISIIAYLIIISILLILSFFARTFRRAQSQVELNQKLQFEMILNLENESKYLSENLDKNICNKTDASLKLFSSVTILNILKKQTDGLTRKELKKKLRRIPIFFFDEILEKKIEIMKDEKIIAETENKLNLIKK